VLTELEMMKWQIYFSHLTNTNFLHTNLLHSILHKIGHVIQIAGHQFVHKTTAKQNSFSLKKNGPPLSPRYMGIHRISTKDDRVPAKHMGKISIQFE
jgi:hypothetical protein